MEISPILQARLMMYCFCFGGFVGVSYDTLGVFLEELEKKTRRVKIIRAFFDVFICVLSAVGLILLSYYFNKGEFRFFSFFGFCIGIFVYKQALSKVFRNVIRSIFRAVYLILRVLLTPLLKICIKMAYFLIKTKYYIQKSLEKIIKMVYNICVQKRTISKAHRGFVKRRREIVLYKNTGEKNGIEKVFRG